VTATAGETGQLILDLGHRPSLSGDDFLVAPSNAAAVKWIDASGAVAEIRPGFDARGWRRDMAIDGDRFIVARADRLHAFDWTRGRQ